MVGTDSTELIADMTTGSLKSMKPLEHGKERTHKPEGCMNRKIRGESYCPGNPIKKNRKKNGLKIELDNEVVSNDCAKVTLPLKQYRFIFQHRRQGNDKVS